MSTSPVVAFPVSLATGYTVTINGQSVPVEAGTLDIHNEIGQRSSCTFTIYDTQQSIYLNGAQVQVLDPNGTILYGGFVDTDTVSKPGWGPTLEHQIECRDYHYLADKRLAFRSYLNTNAGAVVLDLYNRYLKAEGVLLGGVGSGVALPEVVINYGQISQALDSLAQQSGYWWEIDEQRKLWFQPYTGRAAPWTLDGSQADQMQTLTLVRGNPQYVNRQFAKGAYDATKAQTLTLHGNGTQAYTLPYQIASLTSVVINGVTQSVGTKGTDSGKQVYYQVGDAVLALDPSQPLYGAGDTIVVTYTGRYPVVALASHATLISTQRTREGVGTGYVESVYADSKLHTLAAALKIASAMLAHYGCDMTTLTFATGTPGLKQGQLLTALLPMFGVDMANRQMLIRSVEISDSQDGANLYYTVEAIGSPYDVTWQSFFQDLVNQSQDATDPLTIGDDGGEGSTLATLTSWDAAATWQSGTLTHTALVCPIIGPATRCGPTVLPC